MDLGPNLTPENRALKRAVARNVPPTVRAQTMSAESALTQRVIATALYYAPLAESCPEVVLNRKIDQEVNFTLSLMESKLF